MKIGVIGAGSWGTTLANLLAKNGHELSLWAFEPEVASGVNEYRENHLYLPGVRLHPGIEATTDLLQAVDGASYLINAVPTQFIRGVWSQATQAIPPELPIVSASKGIEVSTLKTAGGIFSELFGDEIRDKFAVLSGPSFAREVALGLPTAVTLASERREMAEKIAQLFKAPYFRVYTHDDVIGVELGGALKNVIAVAAGICEGLGLGSNARAALITRGLAEIVRLGVSLGAKAITFWGLSGMGDLVLTCTGDLSRNKAVGIRIGKGEKPQEIIRAMRMVAEGVATVRAVVALSDITKIGMPISEEVNLVIYHGKSPKEALSTLMEREPGPEFCWEERD